MTNHKFFYLEFDTLYRFSFLNKLNFVTTLGGINKTDLTDFGDFIIDSKTKSSFEHRIDE